MKHIVMWKLKDEEKSKNALKIKEMLEKLPGIIPEIKALSVGINENGGEWDIILLSEFSSKEDLLKYDVHPAHEECKVFIRSVTSERAAVDFTE